MRTNWKKIAYAMAKALGIARDCRLCKSIDIPETRKCERGPTAEEIIEHYRKQIKKE